MATFGRFVTDPKVGASCQITLDGTEKILGSSSDRMFTCGLNGPEQRAALMSIR